MLMSRDSSHYTEFLPVAHLYLKNGQIDDTVRLLSGIIERMLAGREERDLLQLVNDVLERDPDHVAALRMLVRINWWQRDMDSLRASLERLAEAAEASELVDEERYALTQLVRLAPDEVKYLERLNLLGGLQEESADDFSVAEPPAGVPEFETFAVVSEDHELATPATVEESVEFETNDAAFWINLFFRRLNESFEVEARAPQEAHVDFQEVDFGAVVTPPTQPQTEGAGEERHENMMRQELESVDFYIAQGYSDIAIDTLDMLEKQFGQHPEITARRRKLKGEVEEGEPAVFEFGGAEELTATEVQNVSKETDIAFASFAAEPMDAPIVTEIPPDKLVFDSGLAELFEEFRIAEEEDTVTGDFETHYNMGTAYKEMELMDEAVQEFQVAVTLVKPGDGTSRFLQCCNMLGHCFMHQNLPEAAALWFKKGLAAPGHTEDEYQALRYD
jgi:tetratricopeptide (TPR) repeat protein